VLTRPPGSDWIAQHRRVWEQKRALRRVYTTWFRRLRGACAADGPIVELGCGPGFFKRAYPEVIATDAAGNPDADRIVDAGTLPFPDGSLGSLVAALPWILSGGFQPLGLLPSALVPPAEWLDRVLSVAPGLTATRCFLVLERTA